MSKRLKDLIISEYTQRLEGVDEALLVNVVGVDANSSVALRRSLREKGIRLIVVKNSLAKRATEGTPLGAAFQGTEGTNAILWGAEDIISLAKEVAQLEKGGQYKGFEARGGVMDGERLTADRVREISKWPNRPEMLSILSGQISGVGAGLSAALLGPGGAVASQIKKKSEESE